MTAAVELHPRVNRLILTIIAFLFLGITGARAQIRIMPLGNSITHGEHGSNPPGGYRDDLGSLLLSENIDFDFVGTQNDGTLYPWHEGHPGQTANYLANNIYSWLSQTYPDIVLLHIGTNDVGDYGLTTIRNNIERLIDEIWRYDAAIPVLICGIIPRNDSYYSKSVELARIIHDIVVERQQQEKPIRYVGQNEVYLADSRWANDYMYDALHPNNTGYSVLAEVYFNVLMNQITETSQLITDNFNRSNLGYTWENDSHYRIINDQLTTDTGGDYWWKPAIYIAEMDPIAVTFTYGADVDPTSDGNAGLALLLNDNKISSADGYLIYKESTTAKLRLFLIENGAVTQLIQEIQGNLGFPYQGDEFKVAIHSDEFGHHFNCFINSEYDGELTDPNKLQGNSSELFAGVVLAGTENNIVDDFKLIYFKDQAEKMFIAWGDEQQGKINTTLTDSLVVAVTDTNGNPIGNVPVTFEVIAGDATIETSETGTHFVFEAENGELTYPMQVMSDPAASGGEYIEVPEQYDDDSMAKAVFTFIPSESDYYVVWGRVRSAGDTHDSFKIMMDQNEEIDWHIPGNWNWGWDQVYVLNGEDPKKFYLTGNVQHTLTVKNREWGSKLDQIIITNDLNFVPDGGLLAKNNQTIITDGAGKAYVKVKLGSTMGPVEISASSSMLAEAVTFHATILSDDPAYMVKTGGDNQSFGAGQQLPLPFEVTVYDQYDNPVQNAQVLFEVVAGGGALVEAQPVFSDEYGVARSTLILGPEIGLNRVSVSCPGYSIDPLYFEANGTQTGYTISGNTFYFSNNAPIDNVLLSVTGDETLESTSDASGNYAINYITAGSDLKVTPSKDNYDNSGLIITPYNAALTLQHVVKLDTLEGYYATAADVDQNGKIQAYDAALISYYVVGLQTGDDSYVGQWLFFPERRNYWNINTDYHEQDFMGLILGDVLGDWEQSEGLGKTITYPFISNYEVQQGESFTVPLSIDEDEHMISCYVIFKYDPQLLTCVAVNKTALTNNFEMVYNIEEKMTRAALYSANEINDAGVVAEFTFQATGPEQETALTLERFQINDNIIQQAVSVISINAPVIPEEFVLLQNYPNPFNPETIIPYKLPQAGDVKINIYNMLGQRIVTLFDGFQQAGKHQVKWDGRDELGNNVGSGMFICETIFNNERQTIKLTKLH